MQKRFLQILLFTTLCALPASIQAMEIPDGAGGPHTAGPGGMQDRVAESNTAVLHNLAMRTHRLFNELRRTERYRHKGPDKEKDEKLYKHYLALSNNTKEQLKNLKVTEPTQWAKFVSTLKPKDRKTLFSALGLG